MLFALTIFVSAFLLFLVQPIIGKLILPWFGGGAAVWSTCLVFFQLALLAGYSYADWITRKLTVRRQALLQGALVAVALLLLPILPDASWKPQGNASGDGSPGWRIFLLLTVTIGLPYFLLSTTGPLVQFWFARAHPGASPYRLFALSNLAALLALLSYPFWVEPAITGRHQAIFWSWGFGLFAVLIALVMWRAVKAGTMARKNPPPLATPPPTPAPASIAPTIGEKAAWVTLAALGSSLLLGVSNQLTQNIPSLPLLWLLPLALYLLTFILCFGSRCGAPVWYPRALSLPLTALAVCAMAWLLAWEKLQFMLRLHIGVFSGGLFIACLYCHSELVARRPASQHLTVFYLMIALGGALGSLFIGILAPLILPAYYELGLTLFALAILSAWLLWRQVHWAWVLGSGLVGVFALSACVCTVIASRRDVIVMSRNFHGTLRVQETSSADDLARKRSLFHGAILHGNQYLGANYRRTVSTYYKTTSGVGVALLQKGNDLARPRRVGIIGLGAGTLAAYGNKDEVFRFYEIDPAVVAVARRDFTYLQDTDATIEIVLGDARLNLEREAAQRFDVLAIDAFSSDSIPVHLITLEALAVYEQHMQPDGIIAFHVSNRFLDLIPVVEKLGLARGLGVALIRERYENGVTGCDWVLLCKDKRELLKPDVLAATQPIPPKPNWQIWTDDFNNLVQVLK